MNTIRVWGKRSSFLMTRLERFAAENGRCWKAKLRHLWNTGENEGLLRQARNIVGPSGLDKLRLLIKRTTTHANP